MQISIILLGKLINFFIMILLGFILVNKNILKSSDSRILSIIVVYLVMPCAIIGSFEIDFTKEKLQHNALRKATPGMEKDNIQYKCISHNSRSPAIFLQDKTASRHPCTDK